MTILEVNELLEEMAEIPGFDCGYASVASYDTIKAAYNGCGPERWPEIVTERLDEITRIFAPAILVHDLDFYNSNGVGETMHEANERLHGNTRAIVKYHYPLATWRMLKPSYRLKRAKAVALMLAINSFTCDTLTARAWAEAEARNYVKKEALGC